MGFFSNQFSNVVEWEEFNEDLLFWKWDNKEIKIGSKLIIRAGQDAIFMFNGKGYQLPGCMCIKFRHNTPKSIHCAEFVV